MRYVIKTKVFAGDNEGMFELPMGSSFNCALDYVRNRMFSGGEPKMIVMNNAMDDHCPWNAVGSHGNLFFSIAIVCEESNPPKELGE